ncbi:unnamed protein product [Owenia fusiformis]|uniref:Uncharacterized protein n=1 Tax=Owenia fusiformis TaxID=6347 RepID=A0A8J1UG65_OWEFU|nr:unnamed protein product [Owenia fusiformis]
MAFKELMIVFIFGIFTSIKGGDDVTSMEDLSYAISQNGAKLNELKTQLETGLNEIIKLTQNNRKFMKTIRREIDADNRVLMDCACERKKYRSNVYHIQSDAGKYMLSFTEAKALCESKGHRLATPDQLQAAYDLGLQVCKYGWVSDGTVQIPMQMPRKSCWNNRGITTLTKLKADAFCAKD